MQKVERSKFYKQRKNIETKFRKTKRKTKLNAELE